MDDAFVAYMILWAAILVYFLLASIDFGAGFFHLLSLRRREGAEVRRALHAYVNPRWEVTNVFLVMTVVAAAAFFPGLVGVLDSVHIRVVPDEVSDGAIFERVSGDPAGSSPSGNPRPRRVAAPGYQEQRN